MDWTRPAKIFLVWLIFCRRNLPIAGLYAKMERNAS